MTSSSLTFELATAEHASAFYGGIPPFSFKGYVALRDGVAVGVGGVFNSGTSPVAFTDMKPEEISRKDRARAYRLLERFIKGYKVPVFAVASEPTSLGLLTKLGFEQTNINAKAGPVLRRMPDA